MSSSSSSSSSSSTARGDPTLYCGPADSYTIEENPISPDEQKALSEMRSYLTTHTDEYRRNLTNPQWLKSQRLHNVRHWRASASRLQLFPDDEDIFCTSKGYLPDPSPWKYGVSAFDVQWPDFLLLRYLRARSMKVKEGAEMFLRQCVWRDLYGTNDMFHVLAQPWRRCWRTHVPNSFSHSDRHGRPVYWEKSGLIDPPSFALVANEEEVSLTHVWHMEWMTQLMEVESRRRGKRVDKACFMVDLGGMGMGHRKLIAVFKTVATIDQEYYPEMLGVNYMINCPMIFPLLWTLCKPFLHRNTVEKMHIHGYTGYQEKLCADLGEEFVPKEYGGKCECRGEGKSCLTEPKELPVYEVHHKEYSKEVGDKKVREEMEEWRKRNGIEVPEEEKEKSLNGKETNGKDVETNGKKAEEVAEETPG